MVRGSKAKYTEKQKRKAEHIAEGYEERGASKRAARERAWATANAMHRGGEKPGGGGYGKPVNKAPAAKVAVEAVARRQGARRPLGPHRPGKRRARAHENEIADLLQSLVR